MGLFTLIVVLTSSVSILLLGDAVVSSGIGLEPSIVELSVVAAAAVVGSLLI